MVQYLFIWCRVNVVVFSLIMNTGLDAVCVNDVKQYQVCYNDVAQKLINDNLLLTALELHTELVESGKEIPMLKEFFSNPGNFEHQVTSKVEVGSSLYRSSSQGTLDSLDLARYSEDGERCSDERVAVLEFELRKARDTITALRGNLTVAAERESRATVSKQCEHVQSPSEAIKPHEQRALNFLINEYLLVHGYKLTSITFADENEWQDFDDWDDVGLNMARHEELLWLYRQGLKSSGCSLLDVSDAACQATMSVTCDHAEYAALISNLQAEVVALTHLIDNLRAELDSSQVTSALDCEVDCQTECLTSALDCEVDCLTSATVSQTECLTSAVDCEVDCMTSAVDCEVDCLTSASIEQETFEMIENLKSREGSDLNGDWTEGESTVGEVEEPSRNLLEDMTTSSKPSNNAGVARNMPEAFKQAVLEKCQLLLPSKQDEHVPWDWLDKATLGTLSLEHLVARLATSLPSIVPNMLLNKREEMIPLLVVTICLDTDPPTKDRLLNLLFNMKKRPQREERDAILQALVLIAQFVGPSAVENHVLPQCWEQITHKYVERRLLVAESCLILTPYVSEAIRNSLIVSIVQQLMQDREETIRSTCVNTLALLITLSSDEDRLPKFVELALGQVGDESPQVITSLECVLFPALAQWSFSLECHLPQLLMKLLSVFPTCASVMRLVQCLLPYLVMNVAASHYLTKFASHSLPLPAARSDFAGLCKGLCDPKLFFGRPVGPAIQVVDVCTVNPQFNSEEWTELHWVLVEFIPNLIEAAHSTHTDLDVLREVVSTLRYLCSGLGRNLTRFKIKPQLLSQLEEFENALVAGEDCKMATIALYLVGVLSTDPEALQEMSNALRRLICAVPLCGAPLGTLHLAMESLVQLRNWQILVLDALWEGVVHQRVLVRVAAAALLQTVIPHVGEPLLASKVAPALVTLASDPELPVRTGAVAPLAMLLSVEAKEIRDKVYLTLQGLLSDVIAPDTDTDSRPLAVQLVVTVTNIYQSCERSYKEDVLLPHLASIAAKCEQWRDEQLLVALTQLVSTILASHDMPSTNNITSHLLPALRCLEAVYIQLKSPYADDVGGMIKEAEARLPMSSSVVQVKEQQQQQQQQTRRVSMSSSGTAVVEDVKQRVSKMFATRPSTLQVSGIFNKKS